MELNYIVTSKDNNKTIKDILLSRLEISHRLLITLKKENCIYINNELASIYTIVKDSDKVTVSLDYEEDNSNIVPKEFSLDIIYEDEAFLIINKPAGFAIHPSILHYEDSISSGVKFYFDKTNLKKKIRPVNRIDKNTSGLVIFAKNEYIQECLARQMKDHSLKKEYIAIVEGHFDKDLKKRNC